jgi:nicotinic acid mononucleotide adenylyltransferase
MFLKKFKWFRHNTAVFAFGRMNPPTIGHLQLVNCIKSIKGDHYLFLSHTQNSKTDPLDFETKTKYARKFFKVEVGHSQVRTIIQALQHLHKLEYTNIVYVAGSDRLTDFKTLIEKYN